MCRRLSSFFVIFTCHLCSSSSFEAFIRYRRRPLVVFAEHLLLILFSPPHPRYLPSSFAIFIRYLRSLSSFVIFVRYLSCLSSYLFVIFLLCRLSCSSPFSFVIFLVCHFCRLLHVLSVVLILCPRSSSSSFVAFVRRRSIVLFAEHKVNNNDTRRAYRMSRYCGWK
jgi:hypothetical protein